MKLLDNEGRFQFIKNQQVEIDKNLKKYKILKAISDRKKSEREDDSYIIVNHSSTKNVDGETRNFVDALTANSIMEYLNSEDAIEFNEKFEQILSEEVSFNGDSINVLSSRWISEENLGISNLEIIKKIEKEKRPVRMFLKGVVDAFRNARNSDRDKRKMAESESISVMDFFSTIHVVAGNERKFVDRISGYFKLFENAKKMGQIAQMDKICQHIIIDIYESVLFANGYTKYVTFNEVEKLKENGAKMVDISYVKNFSRPIPDDIVEMKEKCDDMCVFDNYCVMYYDPEGSMYEVTSEAKRDPILFGLINHSDKLYYIADWEDELCDLTLSKIAELCNVENLK